MFRKNLSYSYRTSESKDSFIFVYRDRVSLKGRKLFILHVCNKTASSCDITQFRVSFRVVNE